MPKVSFQDYVKLCFISCRLTTPLPVQIVKVLYYVYYYIIFVREDGLEAPGILTVSYFCIYNFNFNTKYYLSRVILQLFY